MSRVSGPLLDRIDIHIEVPAVNYKELTSDREGEISSCIRERVISARRSQTERFRNEKTIFCNAHMQSREIRKYCQLDNEGWMRLKTAINKLGLSARAYDRILKVSRTIADLKQSKRILTEHIGEAIQYRNLDRQLWLY
jgi:magnesium chelatase family protein